MRRLWLPPLIACLVGFGAIADSALEPPQLDRYVRWGPLRVRPGLDLANLGYDDNILRARGSQQPIADYTLTLGPHLDGLVLFGRRAFLTFDAGVDYHAFLEQRDENYSDTKLGGRITLPTSRLGVFVEGRADNVQQRPLDLEDARPERRERALGLGTILRIGWRTELELLRRETGFRYEDDTPDIALRLDRDETLTELRGRYRAGGRTSLTLDARTIDVRFRDPAATVPDGDERTVLLGVTLDRGGPLSGRLRAGRTRVEAGRTVREVVEDTVGDASLALRVGRQQLRLELERRIGFSASQVSRYYLTTRTELVATRFLSRLFGIDLRGARGELRFPSAGSGARRDTTELYGVGFRVRFGETAPDRRVEYVLRLERFSRDSSLDTFDSERTVVGIDAQLGF